MLLSLQATQAQILARLDEIEAAPALAFVNIMFVAVDKANVDGADYRISRVASFSKV